MRHISIILLFLYSILIGCSEEKKAPEASAPPADPAALTVSAFKKQEIGAYEEAIEILNRALNIDPGFVPAHYQMGLVYEEWDKRKEAIATYKKVLDLEPENIDAHLGLGSVYAKQIRNDLAVKEYLKAAKIKPGDPEIHFKIALEYWYLQNLPETAEHYRKVIGIDPNHLQAHLNLASVYERMKDWEKALEEIEIAQRLGKETGNQQALSIAERKLIFFKSRMNMTENEMKRKTQPPFD